MTAVIQIIAAFLGSLGFGILYNIRGVKLVLASVGGLLAWSVFLLLGFLTDSEPIRFCIVAMTMSLYAEILARVFRTPTTTFVITSLIPLIPGGALYRTMASLFGGDVHVFFKNLAYTFSLAFAIAIGVVIVTAGVRLGLRVKMLRQDKTDL